MEFPHLMRLVDERQFDTIYHEHFSYFSLLTVREVFAAHGLELFDVEELPTHGGSLRIYARHAGGPCRRDRDTVDGPRAPRGARRATATLEHLHRLRASWCSASQARDPRRPDRAQAATAKTIVGYGAPAKGNTLLNYCGIGTDFIDYTVDRNPHKQGHFLPGTHIPIRAPEEIERTRPDVVFILPWNLREEIMEQIGYICGLGRPLPRALPRARAARVRFTADAARRARS